MSEEPDFQDVQPPSSLQDCRRPGPDRELPGRRLWTIDYCANVVLGLTKRPVSHYPHGEPVPRRRWEFRSMRPIRAKGFSLPHGGGEVCAYHYARLVKFPDNRWRLVYCTRPSSGRHRFSVAGFFTERKGKPFQPGAGSTLTNTLVKPGRTAAIGGYQTPMWTELILHSNARCCHLGVV